ncbi:MAG TPA: DUF5004 domain-containing protein [Puia sp.]|nr:DUF5004 domain-containing protein [Puia sp.]
MKGIVPTILSIATAFGLLAASCATKKEVFAEPVKDLTGSWRVSQVLRNASDITQYVDSTGFRLVLQSDKTYSLVSANIPFVVNSNGTWAADDPQYPYLLSFLPKDSATTIKANIGTPVSKGVRNLQVTFSPGCHSNSYIYIFEKIN